MREREVISKESERARARRARRARSNRESFFDTGNSVSRV